MSDRAGGSEALPRAAAYVRMSTVRQSQSIAHQLDYIARYAEAIPCRLVKTYRDEGKSGVGAKRRSGLLQLLADVAGGDPGYDRILVYDVSRWGRFQNTDESAYYEYWCRRHGIAVIYCAEPFANDGSPLSHIVKSVKRAMAAEFSRALSAKVVDAQNMLAASGYKQGGTAGYALRRLCVRADGSVRGVLGKGERKAQATDRVVFAPGPDDEVRMVQRIFALYVDTGLSYGAIARLFNDEGRVTHTGRRWSTDQVAAILTNEKYCGNLLFNRQTQRMGAPPRKNDPSLWLRYTGAHPSIVSPELFAAAHRIRQTRFGRDRAAVLEHLRKIYQRHGRLTGRLIDAEPGFPHKRAIHVMFGSLAAAYRLALAPLDVAAPCLRWAERVGRLATLRVEVGDICDRMGVAFQHAGEHGVYRIGEVSVLLAVSSVQVKTACIGWTVPARSAEADFVVAALLDQEGCAPIGYALITVAACKGQTRWVPRYASSPSGVICADELYGLFGVVNLHQG